MRIDLNCAKCGENRFNLSEGIEGDAMVWCRACGHEIGTLAQLKERVADQVLKRAEEGLVPPPRD
jgi:DNA-directed RNA polymerase subunit RPC12/RpoP